MAEPTIQLGGGNWAGKSDNLLGYYKEGERFYKQDFTFSRSTTGTYTDSDGYIQEMPYNLLTYSNDFSQWSLASGGSIDVNQTISPDGTQNATKLNTTSASSRVQQSVSLSGINTMSIFVKYAGSDVTVRFERNTTNDRCSFDVSSQGVVFNSKESGIISYNIEQFSNDWYRISCSYDGGSYFQFNGDVTGGGGSVYIYGAQLVKGTSAKTYFPTTTRLNMPRVDYLNNSNGSLILEPQRSNIATYSSDYTQSFYIKDSGITATLNQSTSPTGSNDAAKISVTNNGRIYANHTTGTYATSVFIKAGTFSNFKVQGQNVDLGVSPIITGSLDSEDYGNGWYRLTGYYTGTRSFQVQAYPDNTYSSHTDSGDYYLFGTQIEAGSYATSYIPTSGSSVTRNNDGIPSQLLSTPLTTQGTIFIDFKEIIQAIGDFKFTNASNTTSYAFYFYSDGMDVYNNSAFIVNRSTLEPNNSKVAVSWNGTNVKVYINGNDRTKSGAVASLNNTEKISFIPQASNGGRLCNINQIKLFT